MTEGLIQRLLDRAYCGKSTDLLLEEAANELRRLREVKKASQWVPISASPMPCEGRYLVARNVSGNVYVDLIAYVPDDPAGLPPLPTLQHVTHWAHPPKPPSMLHGVINDCEFDYEIDGD